MGGTENAVSAVRSRSLLHHKGHFFYLSIVVSHWNLNQLGDYRRLIEYSQIGVGTSNAHPPHARTHVCVVSLVSHNCGYYDKGGPPTICRIK